MKINRWLIVTTKKLSNSNIASSRLDSLILLEDELGRDRAWVLAHPEVEIKPEQLKKLNKKVARRASHEPLAYIRGFSEFYGRKFKVNKHVLEPRPESEAMIDMLKNLLHHNSPISRVAPWKIADIGTGCGALGISAALELHNPEVDLYDIDASCLAVARHNAHMHELHLHCYKRDLLNRPARKYDILLANLPYVPDKWQINPAAAREPKSAIFGGPDGLDVYRRLFDQLNSSKGRTRRGVKYVFTEALPPQHQKLRQIARHANYNLLETDNFIQLFKQGEALRVKR
ncbi:peptide chain release factor N(5)-glutamine methyltransferase [Candidatus Saccharibacteria bacterium]|nr:peptide chain release factor N(5)-glutamine methyltransferase [Candidatus Saccharibacteria bacterium]